jgi:uncharacterized integral membrane protein (TIGR00698 family)
LSSADTARAGLPGLGIVVLVAALASAAPLAASLWPALARVPVSPILVAILVGLALSGVARRRPGWTPGLQVAAGPVLSLAVMLIGLRLSLGEISALGLQALPMVAGALVSGLAFACLLGRAIGGGRRLTALIAVGSAICGASAVAATAPALKASAEETAYALACVALFGLLATLAYPWLLASYFADGRVVGLLLGASVHDTAQVTAAALLVEQTFGHSGVVAAATVTKLLRNLAMLFVIPAVTWWVLRDERVTGHRAPLPVFILGFLVFAAIRTAGDWIIGDSESWRALLGASSHASGFLFAMAMAAVGMGISLRGLHSIGPGPAVAALLTAVGMGGVALLLVSVVA